MINSVTCIKEDDTDIHAFNIFYIHNFEWQTLITCSQYYYSDSQIQQLICNMHKLEVKKANYLFKRRHRANIKW